MTVLFVCTGNTCRSPMAAGILNSMNIDGLSADSAGLAADVGSPASADAYDVCKSHGIDILNHSSKPLTKELAENADFIVCMTYGHLDALLLSGVNKNKIYVLGSGISDPFGRGADAYARCFCEIKSAIKLLLLNIGVFTLRDYKDGDETDIALLEKECFSEPWSENTIRSSHTAGTYFTVAELCGKTVGYAGVSIVLDEAYVTNIAVTKTAREIGIGSALLKVITEHARINGASFISLEVRASNTAAICLYTDNGFFEAGVRRNFYSEPREDALILTKYFSSEK